MFLKKPGLYYKINGEGKPLVLLNGIMMNALSWAGHIDILKNNFKIITYDMRDQGRSNYFSSGYNIEIHADDLKELLDSLDIEKANILGLSYGGQAAMIFALKYPQMVDNLILSNTVSYVDNYLLSVGELWKAAAKTYDGETFFNIALPLIYSRHFYNSNYKWLTDRKKIFKETLTREWFDGFLRLASSNENFDLRNEIEKIKARTLLICADEDIVSPCDEMIKMNEKIPGSNIVCVPGSGHALFLEKIDIFCDLIRGFLL